MWPSGLGTQKVILKMISLEHKGSVVKRMLSSEVPDGWMGTSAGEWDEGWDALERGIWAGCRWAAVDPRVIWPWASRHWCGVLAVRRSHG